MTARTTFVWFVALAACSGRALVGEADEGGDKPPPEPTATITLSGDGGKSSGDDDDDGEVGEVAGDGVDDDDGDDGTDTEPAIPCAEPQVPDVVVSVWPGQDPVNDSSDILVLDDLDCVIETRSENGVMVGLSLECADAAGPLPDNVYISVESNEIAVPAELDSGAIVQARFVYTWRDGKHYEEFPWRFADHFALYRDGALVLAGGSGVSFASDANGDHDPAFFDPFVLNVLWTDCPGPLLECHDTGRGAWEIVVGEEIVVSPPFAEVALGGYEVHLGELSTSDSPACGDPLYGRVAFVLARL